MTIHVPTPTEYAAMSWHARAKLIGAAPARRRRKPRPKLDTVSEAQQILDRITPDHPDVCAARRHLLHTEYQLYMFTRSGRRPS